MDTSPSFGYWLRRRRKALDLTQAELAQRVGCVVTTIKKLEADERRPSKQLAERLAECLAIPPDERTAFLQVARAELAPDRLSLTTQPTEPAVISDPAPLPAVMLAGVVTFLFTDVERSTAHWEHTPQGMSGALARHDALLRLRIASHGGQVVKSTGDGVLAAFSLPGDALAAALDAQRALTSEAWAATGPLQVRIAMHTGPAEARGGDYFGPTLNRAARLLAAGHGGQILLSLASAELVRDQLPADVELRDLGVYRLKDLTRPEQIFQLVAPNLPADFPPLRTLDTRRANLPVQSTPLIGREREVAALCALMRREDVRLVTLTGPGGTGKTRLGLQVVAELSGDFPDGVIFVNLAPISDLALVPNAIAQTLDVRETSGQPLLDSLKDYLREKRILLLLDNFEQVADAAPLSAELLTAAPNLKVLVTSRMALHLYGEREFAVPPLALPPRPPHPPTSLPTTAAKGVDSPPLPVWERGLGSEGDLTQYDAVRLFIERAQAVKPDFAVTNANGPAVAEICYRLDGLPLAIELAAARVKLFPPEALLVRLRSPLRLLTSGPRDLPARQQTLRNTIDWSYNLLDDGEQTLFARLGVFVGGCTLEASESVCNVDDDLPMDIMDDVAALVDQSLLQQIEGPDGEPRFMMLETIREYALERLEMSGEAERVRRRHAEYYLALAKTAEPELTGPQDDTWLAQLDAEHDNLRAALAWAQTVHGDGELGLQLVTALGEYWRVCGYVSEGRAWFARVLERNESASSSPRASALVWASDLACEQGDIEQAALWAEESLAVSRGLGDSRGIAAALRILGMIAQVHRDNLHARDLFTESLALFRALGDKDNSAFCLSRLGLITLGEGDYEQAAVLYEECLAVYRELGSKHRISYALRLLGYLAIRQGDYRRARALYEENLAIDQALGYKIGIAHALGYLGDMMRLEGNDTRAATYFEQAMTLYQELGVQFGIAGVLHNLGHVALREDNCPRAATCFTESLELYRKLEDKGGIAYCLAGFAGVARAAGQPERAARLLGAAAPLRNAVGWYLNAAERADYDRIVTAVRAELDEATFVAAWAAGRAMSLERAIAYALE